MDNKQLIAGELAKVIDSLDQDTILNLLEQPKSSELGDIAFPAFSLAKTERKAPQIIAADIAEKIDTTFSSARLKFLAKSSKKSSKTELTTASRTKEIIRISPLTCPVQTLPSLSQSATCALLLSVMLFPTSSAK